MSLSMSAPAVVSLPVKPLPSSARDAARQVVEAFCGGGLTSEVAALWPGWGRLAEAFSSDPAPVWAEFGGWLAEKLPDEAWRTASMVCDTSFYTPGWLVELMWKLVAESGFSGGEAWIPGTGGGAIPAAAPWPIRWHGVEMDVLSAAVTEARVPGMQVTRAEVQKVTVPTGRFDLAIGNVPYAAGWINDGVVTESGLHNYMLRRMVDAVRPGGLVVLLTSRHSVDDGGALTLPGTEVSAAIRLPAGVFAGTEVVADLVVLRKLRTGQPQPQQRWGCFVPEGCSTRVSEYWSAHPQHVAGRFEATGNRHAGFITVTSPDAVGDVTATVQHVIDGGLLPLLPPERVTQVSADAEDVAAAALDGSFRADDDGTISRFRDGQWAPVKASTELSALVGLRDATVALLELEADHQLPDEALVVPREQLRSRYEAYTGRWGPLGRGVLHEGPVDPETGQSRMTWKRPTMGGFRGDPQAHLVFALERFDPGTGEAEAAPILTRRVNCAVPRVTSAATAAEALSVSLAETGRVEMLRIAELLGVSAADAEVQLTGLVFYDPAEQRHVPSATYLSGDVARKLGEAQNAGLHSNAAALQAVLPQPLTAADVRPRLGAPWVPAAVVEQFAVEVLGVGYCHINHSPATARWEVSAGAPPDPQVRARFSTPSMSTAGVLEAALNQKPPTVKTYGVGGLSVDPEETVAAQEKVDEMHAAFGEWVWTDPDRATSLLAIYNAKFNSRVPRQGAGDWLTFPGMSPSEPLWDWQRRMVDRALNSPAVLCGHAVGAGKTRTMLATAWMLRRYGLARKPMIVVPNHLLEQIATEAAQLFPGGKWLVTSTADLSGDRRRLFAARVATGDWDGVILTHAGFSAIPVSPATEERWMTDQLDRFADAMRTEGAHGFSGKQIARRMRSLEQRLETLRSNTHDPATVWWEQLGVDHLSVDEADAFLRLPIPTAASGFTMGASKRATDLLLKLSTLRDENRPHFAAYTGTPWRNTIAETFVWQTYLQPDRLEKAGVSLFDAWCAQFVTLKARIEPAPSGAGLRINTRPTRFQNLADLFRMFDEVADILPAVKLPLPRPDKTTETVYCDPSDVQRRITAELVERSEKLTSSSADNMLTICGEGRRAALDPQLVGRDGDSPKVAAVADRVAQLWRTHRHRQFPNSALPGVLQVVFCDQGTPNGDDPQTYGRVRDALVARGVPGHLIRFVHDATDDKAKARLFAQCRTGEVQVLLASTAKAGVGTNMQTRLAAVHHLDAPWRPADLDQREGRAWRPGNLCGAVQFFRYVCRETFDTFMWAVLTRKASWIEQLTADTTIREADDIGEVEVDFARVAAAAAGDERLFRRAELADTVRRLRMLRAVDSQSAAKARTTAKQMHSTANWWRSRGDAARKAAASFTGPSPLDAGKVHAAVRGTPDDYRDRRVYWGGLVLRFTLAAKTVTVAVSANYSTAAEWTYPTKETRRQGFPAALHTRLAEWADTLPGLPAQCEANAVAADRDAAAAEAFADGWVFSRDAELVAAENELAALDAALTEAAA